MWMHVWCIRVDSWTSVCVHMCIVQLPDWRLACSSLLCWHFANGHLSCAFIRGLLTGLLFSLHPSPFIFYLEHFLGSKGAHIFCSGVSSVCLSSAKGHHGVTQRTFWTVCSMNEELIRDGYWDSTRFQRVPVASSLGRDSCLWHPPLLISEAMWEVGFVGASWGLWPFQYCFISHFKRYSPHNKLQL